MKAADLTIRELQTNLPWTIRYSADFRASPLAHKDFAHSLHHVGKALGRLHELADNADHDRNVADNKSLGADYGKYVADLVVCALRIANTFPGGVLDLQRLVEERIEGKNEVKLPRQYIGEPERDLAQAALVIPPISSPEFAGEFRTHGERPIHEVQQNDDIPF